MKHKAQALSLFRRMLSSLVGDSESLARMAFTINRRELGKAFKGKEPIGVNIGLIVRPVWSRCWKDDHQTRFVVAGAQASVTRFFPGSMEDEPDESPVEFPVVKRCGTCRHVGDMEAHGCYTDGKFDDASIERCWEGGDVEPEPELETAPDEPELGPVPDEPDTTIPERPKCEACEMVGITGSLWGRTHTCGKGGDDAHSK